MRRPSAVGQRPKQTNRVDRVLCATLRVRRRVSGSSAPRPRGAQEVLDETKNRIGSKRHLEVGIDAERRESPLFQMQEQAGGTDQRVLGRATVQW